MHRTILVGDVHGCIKELEALLDACSAGAADRIVFVGDLVAKGPESRAVVHLARELGALGVRGNHDDRVLQFRPAEANDASAPPPSHHAQVAATLDERDFAWLASLPLWLRLPEFGVLVVHGGLVPGLAPEDHDPDDLLNLRSIDERGRPSRRVDGGVPWASRWRGPEHVVFGHDAIRGLQRYPSATGLDTGCVYGRELTALVLPERNLVSVRASRRYRDA